MLNASFRYFFLNNIFSPPFENISSCHNIFYHLHNTKVENFMCIYFFFFFSFLIIQRHCIVYACKIMHTTKNFNCRHLICFNVLELSARFLFVTHHTVIRTLSESLAIKIQVSFNFFFFSCSSIFPFLFISLFFFPFFFFRLFHLFFFRVCV